jgi:hypothetical protein
MDIGAASGQAPGVLDNGWAGTAWFWVVIAVGIALTVIWYFTGVPFGPRGR